MATKTKQATANGATDTATRACLQSHNQRRMQAKVSKAWKVSSNFS